MELMNDKETYDFEIDVGEKESNPVFTMGKLTAYEVDRIDDKNTLTLAGQKAGDKSQVQYLAGTIRDMKINYAVKSWSNITLNKKDVKCTTENKRKLPVWIRKKLEENIDKENKLGTEEDDEERKN
jgi:hypothetical protein